MCARGLCRGHWCLHQLGEVRGHMCEFVALSGGWSQGGQVHCVRMASGCLECISGGEAVLERLCTKAARWALRDLSLTQRVLAANCDLMSGLVYLAYVFPVPFWMGWKLERELFHLIWGGGCKWVARHMMYLEVREGGRGVFCTPLKLTSLYVTFLAQPVLGTARHRASLFARTLPEGG